MSLRDGTKKMSKSDASDYSRLNMSDGADALALKIRRAKTDPAPLPGDPAGLAARPEAANLVGIYAALAGLSSAEVCRRYDGAMFAKFKDELAELAVSVLGPIGAEMSRLKAAPDYVDGLLRRGAERARAIAGPVLAEVEDIVGLLRV